MRRVMIIGGPGSGKSTLARQMGARLDLPVHHMDHIHWLPGWVERDAEEKMACVADIVARDAWVFEGGHSRSYAMRLSRADMLIWLDMPVSLRLWRAVRRTVRDRGKVRPDMQDGCPEMLSMLPEFAGFIYRSRHTGRARAQALFDSATIPRHRFRHLSEVRTYLETLP